MHDLAQCGQGLNSYISKYVRKNYSRKIMIATEAGDCHHSNKPTMKMKNKIFLDVGGHFGDTLDEVLKPAYCFNIVHCFEPQAQCYEFLTNKFRNEILTGHLIVHNYGLADFDGERDLFGGETSSVGASLFADKNDINNSEREKCRFKRASDFVVENINADDLTVMKLNCEGGEILILRDLMKDGEIHKLNSIFISLDIRKIPSQQNEEQKLIDELKACNFTDYIVSEDLVQIKTYSFSKRRRVVRYVFGYGVPPISIWLSIIKEATELRNFSFVDKFSAKMVIYTPKLIWSRIFRMIFIFNRLRYKYGKKYELHREIT